MEIGTKYSAVFPVRDDLDSLFVTLPFLVANSKKLGEIIVVIDDEDDPSQEIRDLNLDNLSVILNRKSGVFSAIATAVDFANFPFVIVGAADDFLPLLQFDKISTTLSEGKDFTSATRYAKSGKRYGGNSLGRFLSIIANFLLRVSHPNTFTDFTTGFKGFRKDTWEVLSENADGKGWSCALKFSLNAIKNHLKIDEVPIISIDRIIGGTSSFRPWLWVKSYVWMIFK